MIEFTEAQIHRFFSRLSIDSNTGCLLFRGYKSKTGHGRLRVNGELHYAHRIAWLIGGRQIPTETPFVLHNCPKGDNPSCCNIDHLYLGTRADNAIDFCSKGQGNNRKRKVQLPRGVNPCNESKNYWASLHLGGVRYYLGTYSTVVEAEQAVKVKRVEVLASFGRIDMTLEVEGHMANSWEALK